MNEIKRDMSNEYKAEVKDILDECYESMPEPSKTEMADTFISIEEGLSLGEFVSAAEELARDSGIDIDKCTIGTEDVDPYDTLLPEIGLWCKKESPISDKRYRQMVRKRFERRAYKAIYDRLTQLGYRRRGYSTHLLKEFDDTNVYEMYMNGEYDRLAWYYSLSFEKGEKYD